MDAGYSERLIMHAHYPKKPVYFNTTALKYVHFYACLFDLAEKGILKAEGRTVWCKETETGDTVLDSVIEMMVPLSGKKLSKLQFLVPRKAAPVYKQQLERMIEKNLLLKEEIFFISWEVGSSYRVIKYDLLKPDITRLERSLVYGRKPERETWLMAVLTGEAGLFNNIFRIKEFRAKAKVRYKELLKSDMLVNDETIFLLRKTLKRSLNAQKAARSYSAG